MSGLSMKRAREFALKAHRGQKDKSGRPYFEHLDAVRKGVQVLGGSKDAEIAALFHDVVEDTKYTISDLKRLGASEATLVIVEAVTKRKNEEQGKYLARVKAAGPEAMRVKAADIMHNTRHDRMAALPEYTRDRLMKKYRPALASLLLELSLIVDEVGQKKLATKPIGSAGGSYSTYGKNYPTTYAAHALIRGDWPEGWKAPILAHVPHSPGKSLLFLLADGSTRVEAKEARFKIKTRSQWSSKPEHDEFRLVLAAGDLDDDKQVAEAKSAARKRSKSTEETVL